MNTVPCLAKGDTIAIEGSRYRFDQQLGDGVLLFTDLRTGAPLQVPHAQNGETVLPTIRWFMNELRAQRLMIEGVELDDGVRRAARRHEFDVEEIRKIDPMADMRMFIVRAFDQHPVPKSEKSVGNWLRHLFRLEETRRRFGVKPPCPSSVIKWVRKRGTPGDRRMIDMASQSNRVARARRIDPVTLSVMSRHVLSYYTQAGLTIEQCYANFVAELRALGDEGNIQ